MTDKSPERLVRRAEVQHRTGLGRSTLYALIQRGKFPRPVALAGTRLRVWPQSGIDKWIEDQVSGNRQPGN